MKMNQITPTYLMFLKERVGQESLLVHRVIILLGGTLEKPMAVDSKCRLLIRHAIHCNY